MLNRVPGGDPPPGTQPPYYWSRGEGFFGGRAFLTCAGDFFVLLSHHVGLYPTGLGKELGADMAEENEEPQVDEEESEESEGGGGGKLVLIIGLINTIGLIGLAYMGMTGGFGGGSSAPTLSPESIGESALQGKQAAEARPSAAPGPKVELGELVVNLKEPTGDRFLKIKAELELDSEETRPEVEGRLMAIRYELNLLLSGQRVVDVQGPDAIETLRKAMIRRANSRLSKGRIVNVWPGEWIVQ